MIEAEMHHPAFNIKQDPPTTNDDIVTCLLPEEGLSFDNPDDPPLDPGGPPFLYENMSTDSPSYHPDPCIINIVNDLGEFNTEFNKKEPQNPKNLLQPAAGMTYHSGSSWL